MRERITLPEQRPVLDRPGAAHPGVHRDRLLFSAKERFDFDQCAITPDPERGTVRKGPGPVGGCAWTASMDGAGPAQGGRDRCDDPRAYQ
ncbi:hypothetical protein [Streptomyces sp. NPDC001851]|uniref:hypothetical protein n=1 Tax=Streptomyces sp. NPDC001851 TaxID=3154529 RepID=UPI00333319C6